MLKNALAKKRLFVLRFSVNRTQLWNESTPRASKKPVQYSAADATLLPFFQSWRHNLRQRKRRGNRSNLSSNQPKTCFWTAPFGAFRELQKVLINMNTKWLTNYSRLFCVVETGENYPCQMQKSQTFSCLFRHYAKHNGLRKEGANISE